MKVKEKRQETKRENKKTEKHIKVKKKNHTWGLLTQASGTTPLETILN
jgi:hypothetical protein